MKNQYYVKAKCTIILVFLSLLSIAQTNNNVLISDDNTKTTADPGAVLEIYSTTKGILIPRVVLNNINTGSWAGDAAKTGMLLWNTSTDGGYLTGFHYWDGSAWQYLSSGVLTETDPAFAASPANSIIDAGSGTVISDAERTKLTGITSGAEANVQPNWSETDNLSDAYIQNKPADLGDFTNSPGFLTSEVDGDINNEIQVLSISNDTIYLTNGGFVKLPVAAETDPAFLGSIAAGITETDTTNWNNKLDSYNETDPVFGTLITDVGSGIVISDTERTSIATNTTNITTNTADILANTAGIAAEDIWDRSGSYTYPKNITDSIGIGTATPGSELEVQGELRLSNASGNYTGFVPHATTTDATYTLPPSDGAGVLTSDGTGGLTWAAAAAAGGWNDDGSVIRLTSISDSVGIGTNAPASELDVAGVITATGFTTSGTLNADGTTTLNDAVTLGDAAGDAITVTGTANFSENIVLDADANGVTMEVIPQTGAANLVIPDLGGVTDTIATKSDLTATPLNSGSGITIDGSSNIDLGGTLDATANIVTGATENLQVTGAGTVDIDVPVDIAGATALAAPGVATTIRGTLDVDQAANFDGNIDANSGLDVTGAAFTTDQAITQSGAGQVTFSGNVDANSGLDVMGTLQADDAVTLGSADTDNITLNGSLQNDAGGNAINMEGATDGDGFQTSIAVVDPTQDNTITLPNATGTVALKSDITNISVGNGITNSSGLLKLGGNLIENTTITQNNSEILEIVNTGDANTIVDLQSTGDFVVEDNNVAVFTVADNGQATFSGKVNANSGLDVTGAAFTTTQAITQSGTGQVTFSGNVDANSGLNVAGAALIVTDQPITQTLGGQVTFAGNVDANNGVDVTGTLNATDNVTIGINNADALTVNATADFNDAVNIDGAATLNSTLNVGGATTLDQVTVNTSNRVIMSTTNAAIDAIQLNAANGDVDINASNVKIDATAVDASSGVLSLDATNNTNLTLTANDAADKTITISATNAGAGNGNVNITADGDISLSPGGSLNISGTINPANLDVDELTQLDQTQINTDDGDLEVTGAGTVDIDVPVDIAGATALAAPGLSTTIRGTLDVDETANFDGNVVANAGMNVTGTLQADDNVTVGFDNTDALTVNATADFNNAVNIDGAATLTSTLNADGAVNLAATEVLTTVEGTLQVNEEADFKDTLRLSGATSGSVGFIAHPTSDGTVYRLPKNVGSGALTSDPSGVLSWVPTGASSGWADNGTTVELTTNTDLVGIGMTPTKNLVVAANATNPTIRITKNSSNTSYLDIIDVSSNQAIIEKVSLSGSAIINIDPKPTDGTGNAQAQMFLNTNTSGTVSLDIYKGDGVTLNSSLGGNTHTYFAVNNGNVGIGTSSPGAKLDVKGEFQITAANSNKFAKFITPATAEDITYTLPEALPDVSGMLTTDEFGVMTWSDISGATPWQETTSVSLVNGTKSVGIGTSTPGQKLEIAATSDPAVRINEGGDATNYLDIIDSTSNHAIIEKVTDSGEARIYINPKPSGNEDAEVGLFLTTGTTNPVSLKIYKGNNTGTVISEISGGTRATYFGINDGGNVGIGTANPGAKLDVRDSMQISDGTNYFRFKMNSSPLTNITLTLPPNLPGAGGGVLYSGTDGQLGWSTTPSAGGWNSNTDKVTLTTTGDSVGIGTTDPHQKLEIVSLNDPAIRLAKDVLGVGSTASYTEITDVSPTQALIKKVNTGNASISIEPVAGGLGFNSNVNLFQATPSTNKSLDIYADNSNINSSISGGTDNTYFAAFASGNVGIGTNSPTTKLDVAGTFNADGATTLKGDVTLGDNAADAITVTGGIVFDEATNDLTLSVNDQSAGPGTLIVPDLAGGSKTIATTDDITANTLNSGSGITIDGSKNIDLGGTLDETANIETGIGNDLQVSGAGILDVDTDANFAGAVTLGDNPGDVITVTGGIVFNEATNDLTLSVNDQSAGPGTLIVPDLGGIKTIATTDDITATQNLPEGSIWVGGNTGKQTGLDAKGDAKILIGNGTTITSKLVSGAINLSNSGSTTLQPGVVTDAHVTAGIAGSKINPNFGSQNITTTGTLNADGAVTLAATGVNTTVEGSLQVDQTANLNGNVNLGNSSADAITVTGGIVFNETTNDLTLSVTDQTVGTGTLTIPDLAGGSKTIATTDQIAGENLWEKPGDYTYLKNTADSVGIGITSPSAKVDILSLPGLSDDLAFSVNGNMSHRFETQFDANALGGNASENKLTIKIDSSDSTDPIPVATFTGQGYVGIGTGTPSSKLTVVSKGGTASDRVFFDLQDDQNAAQLLIMGHSGGDSHTQIATDNRNSRLTVMASDKADGAPRVQFIGSEDTTPGAGNVLFDYGAQHKDISTARLGIRYVSNTGGFQEMFSAGSSSVVVNDDGNPVSFRVESDNNTHALFVRGNDGNVGIGTTSPSHRLEVSDAATNTPVQISTYSATDADRSDLTFFKSSNNTLGTLAATADNEALGSLIGAGVNTGNSKAPAAQINFEQDGAAGATNVPGRITFATSDGTAAATERMRIDSAGNVGIGTTDLQYYGLMVSREDTYSLVGTQGVYNGGADTVITKMAATASHGQFGTITAHPMKITTNNSPRMHIGVDGNVGIGTNTPGYSFEVSRTGETSSITATRTDGALVLFSAHENLATIGTQTNHEFRFNMGGDWKARINTNGSFSVGTANLGNRINLNPSGNTYFDGGDVGIGTVTPIYKLDVNGTLGITGNFSFYNTAGLSKLINTDNNNSSLLFQTGTTTRPSIAFYGTEWGANPSLQGDIYIDYGGKANTGQLFIRHYNGTSFSNNVFIDSDGNVGIGTTSPNRKLDVENAGPVYAQFTNSTADPAEITTEIGSSAGAGVIGTTTNHTLIFNTNNTEKMRITKDGNVAIGSTNPGAFKLYVAGNAHTTGTWGSSDRRWKKNILPLENSLSKVLQLQGVSYYWNREKFPDKGFTETKQVGLIAQDTEKIIPELVATDDDGYKSISYEKIVPVLIEAVKEQQKQIEALLQRVEELEKGD